MEIKTPGRINYETLKALTVGKSKMMTMPDWEKLPTTIQERHETAAKAVLDSQPCQHPWGDVDHGISGREYCTKCEKEL